MAVSEYSLRDLVLNIAGYHPKTESPTNFVPEEAENITEGTSSSDEHSGHDQETDLVPEENQPRYETVSLAADHSVDVEERTRFLELVKDRFPAEDDPYKIHDEKLAILTKFQGLEMEKFAAHNRACVLLVGHGDLLQEFEQLLKIGDQMYDWRSRTMERLMHVTEKYLKSTVKEITIKEELTPDHLRRILRFIRDPVERKRLAEYSKMADQWRSAALRRLLICRMEDFLSSYFGQKLNDADLCDDDDDEDDDDQ